MKKILMVLAFVLLLTAAASEDLFAQQINLGTFPVGSWLDTNYNAVWEFSSNNIVIKVNGAVVFDFSKNTIQNFNVGMVGTNPSITFSCPQAGRTYRFTTRLPGSGLTMTIDRPDEAQYVVNMDKQ
ncbi:MAG: hypothetical protein FWB86_00645 [Treponema sp.]|nr:hypothetical protein [Treponema sp.]MCL2250603.1 hypothetical protein [Treponema sp.]